jgi:hypothetical protein
VTLATILSGDDDELAFDQLRQLISVPSNPAESTFATFWDVTDFIASDGFEWLFEQPITCEELQDVFTAIGFMQGVPYLRRAYDMVPKHLLGPDGTDERTTYLIDHFDAFNNLLHEYLSIADSKLLATVGNYVRNNASQFSERSGTL